MRSSLQILAHHLSTSAFGGRFNCSIHGATHTSGCDECLQKIGEAINDAEVRAACTVTGRSCSWCDYINEVTPRRSEFCAMCGHSAQVPRVECYCSRCVKTPAQ
jgi:hypothetical protein